MDNLEICPECIGEGYPNFCDDEPCPTCAGRGRVTPERKEEYYQDLWNTESPAYRRYIERNKAELEQMVEERSMNVIEIIREPVVACPETGPSSE